MKCRIVQFLQQNMQIMVRCWFAAIHTAPQVWLEKNTPLSAPLNALAQNLATTTSAKQKNIEHLLLRDLRDSNLICATSPSNHPPFARESDPNANVSTVYEYDTCMRYLGLFCPGNPTT